jgi:hypothetical protein
VAGPGEVWWVEVQALAGELAALQAQQEAGMRQLEASSRAVARLTDENALLRRQQEERGHQGNLADADADRDDVDGGGRRWGESEGGTFQTTGVGQGGADAEEQIQRLAEHREAGYEEYEEDEGEDEGAATDSTTGTSSTQFQSSGAEDLVLPGGAAAVAGAVVVATAGDGSPPLSLTASPGSLRHIEAARQRLEGAGGGGGGGGGGAPSSTSQGNDARGAAAVASFFGGHFD